MLKWKELRLVAKHNTRNLGRNIKLFFRGANLRQQNKTKKAFEALTLKRKSHANRDEDEIRSNKNLQKENENFLFFLVSLLVS